MNFSKPALLYADQLALLVSRNLTCSDHARALAWLQRIGYYRLSAYFISFRDPGTNNFRTGTTLDDILSLYKFDGCLRLLTMQAMDRIEIAVRAVVTYQVAHTLGVFGYADPANFISAAKHSHFMDLIQKEERRSAEVFVDHFRGKYTSETYLPIWMATELISFGALSQMYANLRSSMRKKIAREFNLPAPVFESWLHTLAAIRNTCAHHARLWNRELSVKPELPNSWKAQGLDNRRFYIIALIIQTLLNEVCPQSQWKERLKTHFGTYPVVHLASMHFPQDWKQLPIWRPSVKSAREHARRNVSFIPMAVPRRR